MSTETTPKYLLDGREVVVRAELPNGRFLVAALYDVEGEDEPVESEDVIVSRLFDSPPVRRLHQAVAQAQAERERLRQEIVALRTEASDLKLQDDERRALVERLKQVPALQNLESFISAKITHYVLLGSFNGVPKIITKAQAIADDPDDHNHKLLTLYGRANGDLMWKLNRWTDGSGSNERCVPCCSEDEAKQTVRNLLIERLRSHQLSLHVLPDLIKAAESIGCEVPQIARDRLRAHILKNLIESKAKAEATLAETNAKIAALAPEGVTP